ncbi:hypothetical protein CBS147343_10347 [Aspergillus niger]|nr:hypothetical protein CBS11350_6987 [Aspergillus niger]KAI2895376.1 hypothetical protein CBS11852_4726 [Aspergillus niger]KAI2959360.1 hypothetical protein CBS147323_8399 [Aspergillus niger]KAI3057185.1 hypothetical protein CBS147343_10347 [Aspergillus niger]KAI3066870.1 hypothetical protein CBS147353_7864 [Aspergillus niger]
MAELTFPIRIGDLELHHRVVMAPLTRNRADAQHVPLPMSRDYYSQRASVPGTLIITEGTFISARAGGMGHVPGIWSDAQIAQWKTITAAVHSQGSFIFCQLWALGRAAKPDVLQKEGGYRVVSSGDIPMSESSPAPTPLTEEEISGYITDYVRAAQNAIAAGFDGVEIHGANGYLPDQFTQSVSNNRTDQWGGSVENRSRFGLAIAQAVADAIGPQRTGYRISPWSTFQGMRMSDPQPQFTHLVRGLAQLNLAYLHVVRPRISGSTSVEDVSGEEDESFLFDAFGDKGAIILAGGFTAQTATEALRAHPRHRVAIAFGRHFLANPDLPFRLREGLPLNKYDRPTFYTPMSPKGYVDYPFSEGFSPSQGKL